MLDNHVVLARNAKWPANMFSMITGFMAREESPTQTLGREIGEELGLRLDDSTFLGHHPFAQANQLIIAFLARCSGELSLGDEIAETKVVPAAQLPTFDFGPNH